MHENVPVIPAPDESLGFDTATIRAGEVDEYFFRLVSMQVGSLAVDGFDLVFVNSVGHLDNGNVTQVVCSDSTGRQHEFTYATGQDAPIVHRLLAPPTPES